MLANYSDVFYTHYLNSLRDIMGNYSYRKRHSTFHM